MNDVLIIGGGIGGLTLALMLHRAGVPCRIFEATPEFKPVGVGVNILPHATREFTALGLEDALARVAVTTAESVFFNRFGQLIWREPSGRLAGYEWPQFSIHRADLHAVLLDAVRERVGADRLRMGHRCIAVTQDENSIAVAFQDPGGRALPEQRGRAAIACDGIHSAVRRQYFPEEGDPIYSGVNMWRGTTRWPRFLSGASMVRAGWLKTGKMVIYPIRDDIDGRGTQLINWVCEIETPVYKKRDWNRPGNLDDFLPAFADWHFDWLDAPELIRQSEMILEFPMVDHDPLPRWSHGRVTLLGDAAHPMYPRGSNGAGQAILDARALADALASEPDAPAALKAYEAARLETTAAIVRANRTRPPDIILGEIFRRTGDRPFARIEDVISADELAALSDGYKRIAGYDKEKLAARP
jgi:2-polyprenyl-6-methoxyphenol hydroxylase-like FAD-dependent oxidoreductase